MAKGVAGTVVVAPRVSDDRGQGLLCCRGERGRRGLRRMAPMVFGSGRSGQSESGGKDGKGTFYPNLHLANAGGNVHRKSATVHKYSFGIILKLTGSKEHPKKEE